MTPPKAPEDSTADHGNQPSAVSICAEPPAAQARPAPQPAPLLVLSKRSEFLAAARARRQGTKSMMVQGRKRKEGEAEGIRVGFTCSKKVGNAVARNRAKRRLREAARMVLPQIGHVGWDYVLIGRAEATAARDFEDLKRDLAYAVKKIHG